MKRLSTLLTSIAFSALFVAAQSDIDALRYSQQNIGFTARSLGAGGAFGALGTDLSSTSINPAGVGLYRSNTFSVSGGMNTIKSKMTYNDNTRRDFDFNMGIPSVGLVFTNKKYENRQPAKKGWIQTNFSMSLNQTDNYNAIINYGGINSDNSMLNYFAERANGLTVSDLAATESELVNGYYDIETMIWDAYLIDSVGDRRFAPVLNPSNPTVIQKNIITSSGSKRDISFTLASNFENMFFIGGGLTISTIRYNEENRFAETAQEPVDWTTWGLTQNLLTKGVGISGNLGIIARPNNNVRAGLSIQTPMLLNLRDEYSDQVDADFEDGTYSSLKSVDGYYDYKVLTPLRTTLSAAYLFGKKGFVSADMDLVDYSTMRLRPVINAFEQTNDIISEKYTRAYNLRIGGEYVLKMLRFRGGYAYSSSPIANVSASNNTRNSFTGGLGIHDRNWSLDMAVMQQLTKRNIQPYVLDAEQVPLAQGQITNNRFVVTLSTKF